jgi:hypothetical protein
MPVSNKNTKEREKKERKILGFEALSISFLLKNLICSL